MSNPKVLIIDDEEDICEIMGDSLELEDFKVAKALSSESAIQLFSNDNFNVVICDENLPGMKGRELLQKIAPVLKEKKILFYLSTGAVEANDSEIVSAGGTGVINKPFDMDQVIERIQKDLKLSKSKSHI